MLRKSCTSPSGPKSAGLLSLGARLVSGPWQCEERDDAKLLKHKAHRSAENSTRDRFTAVEQHKQLVAESGAPERLTLCGP